MPQRVKTTARHRPGGAAPPKSASRPSSGLQAQPKLVIPAQKKARIENGGAVARDRPSARIQREPEVVPVTEPIANPPAANSQALPTSFKIIAGSYEKNLYGLEATYPEAGPSERPVPVLKPIFIFPAHVACVKAVASSPDGGKWLATGSTDEVIKVWNLRRRKEVGGLQQHEGSITFLSFPTRSHLVSASEDGTLCIFRTRGWELLRSLKGHTGRVNCVAVHPSGKVALSVGKDRTMRMWDLMRGKGAASVKLGKEGEIVRWSRDGSRFALQAQSSIDLYTTDMKLIHAIIHPSRIHDIRFRTPSGGSGEVLLVGAEDKKVTVYKLGDAEGDVPVIAELVGHSNRVKSIDTIAVRIPSSDPPISITYAVTVSSDGFIRLYDLSTLPSAPPESSESLPKIEPITSYDTKGSRLTCVAFGEGELPEGGSVNGKRKRDGGEAVDGIQSEESDDEEEFEGFGEADEGEVDGEEEEHSDVDEDGDIGSAEE